VARLCAVTGGGARRGGRMSRRPHAWAAYRVPCPRCGVPAGAPCEEPINAGDTRQTCIPGTGRTRRVPHGERVDLWAREPGGRP
jgi:hypothetical protein